MIYQRLQRLMHALLANLNTEIQIYTNQDSSIGLVI
jgi:hypothetical protein